MNKKPDIYVIGTRGFPNIQGGVETHCDKLYSIIANNGFKIKVFRRKPYVKSSPYCYPNIIFKDIWTLKKQSLETFLHSFYASFYCIAERPKIVHIHNIGPALIIPILKLVGIKTIVSYHSQNYLQKKWNIFGKKILQLGELLTRKMADKIIIVSKDYERLFPSRLVEYIPNGVDKSIPVKETTCLKKNNIIPKKYILIVARLSPEKGIDILIKAFKKVDDHDLQLVIVGDSDQDTPYSKAIKAAIDADKNIIRTGFLTGNDLAQIYSHALLFVLPSYHEGLPIVALEAMSYDLPMLLSDIPANREVASPGETFPVGDVDALADKISRFIRNPSAYFDSSIREQRQKRLNTEFNWDLIAQKTQKVYESLK